MWYRPRWRDIWGDINYWVIFWWTVFGLFVITVLLQLFFRTEVGKKRKKELDQVWRDCVVRFGGLLFTTRKQKAMSHLLV